ncbi:Rrf2 family transcriptional regulator [Desulfovibrio sp. OttesenSCG-928-A18]|nr:Rrf2 family transcriptional regulator [Desulfovibrio sp. OttesenSCG-928-A18]
MKLSPNTRYAVRILFELGGAAGPVSIAALSGTTGITLRTVELVHTVLKKHGVTQGFVGPRGGIHLKVPLSEVSLGQLILWFDEGIELNVCCGDKADICPRQRDCCTSAALLRTAERLQMKLNNLFLQDIIDTFSRKK